MYTIKSFSQFLRKNGYSECTIENYCRGVKSFWSFVGNPTRARNADVELWKQSLNSNPRTVNLYIHALRKYYFYLDYVDVDFCLDPKKLLCCREIRKEQDYIVKDEVGEFLDKVKINSKSKLEQIRNTLLIKILWECGVRVGELLDMKRTDIGPDFSIKILGKGGKERIVFLSNSTIELLTDYKILRMKSACNTNHIFISFSHNSLGKKLSRNSAENIVRKLNNTGKHITPHSFRHGFATHTLRAGGNLVDLQKTLGHSNLSTTSTYLHSNDERIHEIQRLAR